MGTGRPKPGTPRTAPAAQEQNSHAQASELETLAVQSRDPNKRVALRAYERLVALERRWTGVQHARAALAIGYYDYSRGHYADAAAWFRGGRADPLLSRYALYWEGLAAGQAGQDADAISLIDEFLRRYPDSVLTTPALIALADAAIDAKQPDLAIGALKEYSGTGNSASLLLHLAMGEERAADLADAARDYERVYDLHPLAIEAKAAGKGIERLRAALGAQFPEAPIEDQWARAETLLRSGEWKDARAAFERLRDRVTGTQQERANLGAAECDAELHHSPDALASLALSDPSLDAERWLAIARVYRARSDEDGMKSAVEKVVGLAAAGASADQVNRALFLMGNYYWANLKRDQASDYYKRLLARQATGAEATIANWRIAWTAYLENQSDAAKLLLGHIQNYPDSPDVPDALYWLGRLAERSGDTGSASAYYEKASTRFAETYFGRQARERLRRLQASEAKASLVPVLDRIPPLPPAMPLADDIPAAARPRYERGLALRSIGFDETALLEFRAAYDASKAPALLVEAARAAQGARHYLTGAALIRQLVPDMEWHPMDAVPADLWRIVYPLPYAAEIRSYALRDNVDPMLLASLVRQESGFQADAVSAKGAIGMTQLMPFTARKWSRKLRLGYSRRRLVEPEYNLRVGGAYLRALIEQFGSVEEAVAAYNAGENRVSAWLVERHYDDPAEFVESIPFTQTRNYVEVVLDGAVIYGRLYGTR